MTYRKFCDNLDEFVKQTCHPHLMALADVYAEFEAASLKFKPFNSAHEGYGILLEELDELWEEVRGKQGSRDLSAMRAEAVQVGAMALRFIIDICDQENDK